MSGEFESIEAETLYLESRPLRARLVSVLRKRGWRSTLWGGIALPAETQKIMGIRRGPWGQYPPARTGIATGSYGRGGPLCVVL